MKHYFKIIAQKALIGIYKALEYRWNKVIITEYDNTPDGTHAILANGKLVALTETVTIEQAIVFPITEHGLDFIATTVKNNFCKQIFKQDMNTPTEVIVRYKDAYIENNLNHEELATLYITFIYHLY